MWPSIASADFRLIKQFPHSGVQMVISGEVLLVKVLVA
jgi:hypothetical protein